MFNVYFQSIRQRFKHWPLWFLLFGIFTSNLMSKGMPASEQQLFRDWLSLFAPAEILRQQQKRPNPRWGEKNRDCAGFIRYLIWEVSDHHNKEFRLDNPTVRSLPDIQKIFRPQMKNGLGKNSSYLAAEDLIAFNTYFLGRSKPSTNLKIGDLLFFRDDSAPKNERHHLMLLLIIQNELFVIYHTGEKTGELRLLPLTDLMEHPQDKWHPIVANPHFLGFFRFNFLD